MTETGKSRTFDKIYLSCNLPNKGNESFKIKGTYLDELAHNTKDHNGSELGVKITSTNIYIGNDTNPMTFEQLGSAYIDYKSIGHRTQSTGFWGVGGSKKFTYKHGLIGYHCSIEGGKYLYREFTYDGLIDYTHKSISENVTGFSVKEYEITEEKYKELTFADEFKNGIPTWFISINRYSDCKIGLRHNAELIIKYLNSSFMNVVNFKCWLDVEGQKRQETKKVYYPTVRKTDDSEYYVPDHYSKLEKIKQNWEIVDGVFVDIYFFDTITENKDGVKWVELKSKTNDGNEIYYTNNSGGRKQDPRHIYINHQDVTLVNQMVNTDMGNRQTAYYQNLIIKLVSGEIEYNTMKTSGISEDINEQMVAFHKEWLNENTEHHYSSQKGEDSKGDDLQKICLDTDDTQQKNNLNTSIYYLSGKEIDEDITSEEKYWSIRENHEDRECDVILLNENDENILHFELQNETEDWRHIDGWVTRAQAGVAKHNVLVVDSLSNKTAKKRYAKKCLDKSNTTNCWIVSYSDLIKGKKKSFVEVT